MVARRPAACFSENSQELEISLVLTDALARVDGLREHLHRLFGVAEGLLVDLAIEGLQALHHRGVGHLNQVRRAVTR